MLTAEYLRSQAETCLRIARACFDLSSAERLRLMAADLTSKAVELEKEEKHDFAPHMIAPDAASTRKTDRG